MDPQQAASALMRLINGYQISQVIHVAATLGIADLLKDGSRASADIANATSTHPSSTYRLLHALASAGVLEERADAHFSLTDIGQYLRSELSSAACCMGALRWTSLRLAIMGGPAAQRHDGGERVPPPPW